MELQGCVQSWPQSCLAPDGRALYRPHASVLTEEPAPSLNVQFFFCEAGPRREEREHLLVNGTNPTQPVWSAALGLLQVNEGQHSYDLNADLRGH